MTIKLLRFTILVIIGMASIFSKCRKDGVGCAETQYTFNLEVRAYPDNSTVAVGDTIWLEINSLTTFQDITSRKEITYKDASNLGTAIGFGKFYGRDSVKDAANSFDFDLLLGRKVENPHSFKIREYLFAEQANKYLFKVGIIPKEKGVFGISLSNSANVFRKSDKCTKALFILNFEKTQQHYFLNPYINSSNTDTTKPGPSYYFEVK